MKKEHKAHKASGGEVYSGKGSNVAKEAEEKKHGGRVKKEVAKPEGEKSKKRMDKRPRKASGGRVGSGVVVGVSKGVMEVIRCPSV